MKKATRIAYDPYANSLSFEIRREDGDWVGLSDGSDLVKYEDQLVLFSNCAVDIVSTINEKQNSMAEGLEIQFLGPDEDYEMLEKTVKEVFDQRDGAGPLLCKHIGTFRRADETLDSIRSDYEKIAAEFAPYLPGGERYEGEWKRIGDGIVKFDETISDAIPVCVIGNYSVGKSALINSLIGEDVLPSKMNPSTAKNVEVVRSDEFRVTLLFPNEESEMEPHGFDVVGGHLRALPDDPKGVEIAEKLNAITASGDSSEFATIRNLLDALNEGQRHQSEADFLSSFGWNVVVELPFRKSLLDDADNKIVFFDTPGSDNVDIDQQEHQEALQDLLGEQTNALPILVTARDRTSGRSTGDVMHMLDEYKDNFSSPSCLVVLTKCDKLTKSELQESVSSDIRNWHGKSIILFTTPIGALGTRKGGGSPWLDESYEEAYEDWQSRQSGTKKLSLPDYNCYPCGRRGSRDELGVSPELYDTGIPSLEFEILYYIENHAKYKKCVRGRRDLLDALAVVEEELNEQRSKASKAKARAQKRKAEKRTALIAELDAIQIAINRGLDKELASQFQGELDRYCANLPATMGRIYDDLNPDDPLAMDDQLNARIRRHCQENLIDATYLAQGGVRDRIVEIMSAHAEGFADKLQGYVSKNESHFSDFGKAQLREYLDKDLKPPTFSEVKSVLESLGEVLEKATLAPHFVLRLFNNPEGAKSSWLSWKAGFFEQNLRGGTGLFGKKIPSLFLATAFTKPIKGYFRQLLEWADEYREHIKGQLDNDNVLLSDMEEEIERLDATIRDLEDRLSAIADAEARLEGILEPMETRCQE